MSTKTSIKIKKFWFADVASDGDVGTNWQEIQVGQREATVQFNGSDADVSNYKNVVGNIMESAITKGDKTMNFQLADLSPDVIAEFTGGTVTTDSESIQYDAPNNENQNIEKSIKFLTEKNILFIIPRASFDGYPIINDDDLHYYQMNSTVLKPEKSGVPIFTYHELLTPSANDITVFTFGALDDSAATINTSTHVVDITVVIGTDPSALTPTIDVSLGASIDPASGVERDFSSAVTYDVEAADGTVQTWTVNVTVAT
jgi:hypothetical protein